MYEFSSVVLTHNQYLRILKMNQITQISNNFEICSQTVKILINMCSSVTYFVPTPYIKKKKQLHMALHMACIKYNILPTPLSKFLLNSDSCPSLCPSSNYVFNYFYNYIFTFQLLLYFYSKPHDFFVFDSWGKYWQLSRINIYNVCT